MAHIKDIKIYVIAQTEINDSGMSDWLEYHKVNIREVLPFKSDNFSDAEQVIGLAAKRCYLSFEPGINPNVTRVRKNWHDYLGNILKSKHGSVLEHAHYTFAIEGLTRVATAELNRHRAGVAISEGSMRYIRFDDIAYWLPESIKERDYDNPSLRKKKNDTKDIFNMAFYYAESFYKKLCDIWDIENITDFSEKKILTSMFRRIVPMGVSSGGVWTFNLRALRHIIALRSSEGAEEEICYIAGIIAKEMISRSNALFGDFKQNKEGFWVPEYEKV